MASPRRFFGLRLRTLVWLVLLTTVSSNRVTWLTKFMSRRRVRELIPEAADLDIEVYVLPNLGGINVLIHGLLDEGVAATARFDPQAKGLAEWIRSRLVNIEGNVL